MPNFVWKLPNKWRTRVVLSMIALLVVGCVSSEKYETEKARALNFQRLLAQEEKRTGELNVQVQEAKRQAETLEAQSRDLMGELDALRDQLATTQEQLTTTREEAESSSVPKEGDLTLSEPSVSEFGLQDFEFNESDFKDMASVETTGTGPAYHTVSRGETLYSISRQYGVTVPDLKKWNNLLDSLINVGQRLIVSSP